MEKTNKNGIENLGLMAKNGERIYLARDQVEASLCKMRVRWTLLHFSILQLKNLQDILKEVEEIELRP